MPFTSECARSPAGPPPDVAADTPTHSRREFCLALKSARERRGLTIAQIAETTKVCPSHFEALERGELRLWPKGLYRRTFFRGYVTMVGLPVTDMLEEFLRLFPEDGAGGSPSALAKPESGVPRIALDDSWRGSKGPVASRILTAVLDSGVAVTSGWAISWLTDSDPALTIAFATLSYFTLGTLLLGSSPIAWAWPQRARFAHSWHRSRKRTARVPAPAGEPAGEFRMGEARSWTTDAHRIRPSHVPPRIRVRFRWS
jgi:hypothetical protein